MGVLSQIRIDKKLSMLFWKTLQVYDDLVCPFAGLDNSVEW